MKKWRTMHIFIYDINIQNKVLVEIIKPVIKRLKKENKLEKWFYIKYWEGGPHIRLRLLSIDENSYRYLENLIKEFLSQYPPSNNLTKEIYYKNHKFDGESIDIKTLEFYKDHTIKEIEYIPELDRYGGKKFIEHNECIFMMSSELALDILEVTGENIQQRFSISIDIYMSILKRLNLLNYDYIYIASLLWKKFENKENNIFYTQKILDVFSIKFSKLEKNILLNNYLDSWVNDFCQMIKKIERKNLFFQILSSQIHMNNNRIDITPEYEYITNNNILTILKNNPEVMEYVETVSG